MHRHDRPARFRSSGRECVSDSVTDERKQPPPSWRKLVTPNLHRANNILVIEENLASDARLPSIGSIIWLTRFNRRSFGIVTEIWRASTEIAISSSVIPLIISLLRKIRDWLLLIFSVGWQNDRLQVTFRVSYTFRFAFERFFSLEAGCIHERCARKIQW